MRRKPSLKLIEALDALELVVDEHLLDVEWNPHHRPTVAIITAGSVLASQRPNQWEFTADGIRRIPQP